jgi:uncharacterized Zn finger protein (UPF0148 family)
MAALFGPSEQDLERLRSTVQSLGTTSVPGLAAALSWRERKAERLLAHELARPGTPITYDPGRRTVRWALALPELPTAPLPAAPAGVRSSALRFPAAPTPIFTPVGLKTLCPTCRIPLQATGSGNLAVCPQCGRLSSVRTSPASTAAPVATTAPTSAPAPTEPRAGAAPLALGDRRSQELFAAWIGSKPIPCPKCRTPLRHRGVSEYACPACGHQVLFPSTPGPAIAVPPTPPA